MYVRTKLLVNEKTYWECKKVRGKLCKARIITNISGQKFNFVQEPTLEDIFDIIIYQINKSVKYKLLNIILSGRMKTNQRSLLLGYYVQK